MSQEITLYNRIQDPIEAAIKLGKPYALMFGLSNEAQGVFLALAAFAENKTPFDIVRTYDIVDGKLRKKALAIYAEFRAKGGKVRWINTGNDGQKATAEFTFEGNSVTDSFTIEDAKKQFLLRPNSAWTKTPGNMLRARLLSNVVAMLCPEIVAGVSGNPEDESETDAEPKALLPTQPVADPKPAQVTSVTTVPPPSAGQPAEPQPQLPKPAEINWANPRDPKKVSPEGAAALAEAIPADDQATVLKWLEDNKWIQPLGSLLDLTPQRALSIHKDTAKFVAFVRNGGKKG